MICDRVIDAIIRLVAVEKLTVKERPMFVNIAVQYSVQS